MTLTPSHPLRSFLEKVLVALPQSQDRLTIWPIVQNGRAERPAPPYVPLAQAIDAGTLHLDEVDESGSVSHISADRNSSAYPVRSACDRGCHGGGPPW